MSGGSRLSWVVTAAVAGVYAAAGCAAEVAYLAAGRDGYADVTAVCPGCRSRPGPFRSRRYQDVTLAFTEPGGAQRTATVRRSAGWQPPANRRVAVRYTPGKDGRARVAGDVDWLAVLLGAGLAGVGAVAAARFAVGVAREVGRAAPAPADDGHQVSPREPRGSPSGTPAGPRASGW